MNMKAIEGHKVLLAEAIKMAKESGDINTFSLLNGSMISINLLQKEIRLLEKKIERLKYGCW